MSLVEFFHSPNRTRPDSADPDGRLAHNALAHPESLVVLPWDDGYRGARWYVLADNDRLEQVREELVAHAGVSYTDFRGQPTVLEEDDPGDTAAASACDDRAIIRINLIAVGERANVGRALMRFLDLWDRRPPPGLPPARPAAEILREYRLALAAASRPDAEAAIAELRATGAIEIVNLRFLDLELLSVFEGPTTVLEYSALPMLLRLRRPARATDLIARAVDRARLRHAPFSATALRERFRHLDSPFQELLTTPGECRSSSGALLLGLRTDAMGGDVAALIEHLIDVVELEDEVVGLLSDLAEEKADRPGPSPSLVTSQSLGDLLVAGSYDEVLKLASSAQPSREIVEAALRSAQWLDSIEAARVALQVLESAPADVRELFSGHRVIAPMVEALRDLLDVGAPHPAVRNWNEFFENLWNRPTWPEAVDTAAHGATEWPVRDLLTFPEAIATLAGHVSRGSSTAPTVFARVVPHLIDWLDRMPDESRAASSEIEEALIAYLALDDQSRIGLDLLGAFAADVISRGLDVDRYGFVLDSLEERWQLARSPATTVWAADVIEVVVDQPCPDRPRRANFVSKLLQTSAEFLSRVPSDVVGLLEDLAGEIGLRGLLPVAREESDRPASPKDVSGIVVALYSLTESALRRAHAVLTRRWPGLEVVTRSDAVGSDVLSAVARRAHLFVLAPRSAKHAATLFITDKRPSSLPTRFARGKGSASLVREVDEWIGAL